MTINKIKTLYKKYQTPPHVRAHMAVVAKVAVFLAKKMKTKKIKKEGVAIDIEFVKNLALLHDFLKMLVFKEKKSNDPQIWKMLRKKYPNMHDTEAAAKILEKMKEKLLAKSIKTQQFDAIISRKHPLETNEEKVVYYADKRVAHAKVVSLDERFSEGEKRYGKKVPTRIRQKILELEKTICAQARIKPEVLKYTRSEAKYAFCKKSEAFKKDKIIRRS